VRRKTQKAGLSALVAVLLIAMPALLLGAKPAAPKTPASKPAAQKPAPPKPSSPDDIDTEFQNQQEKLETLRQRAEAARKAAQDAALREQSVLERLNKADEALKATRDYLRRLELGENLVEEQIKKTTLELSWAQDELETRRDELVHRLRYAYMYDQTRSLEIIFSAESLPSLLQRTAFLNRVLQQDRRLIDQVAARQADVKATLGRLEQQRAEMQNLLVAKQQEEQHYATLKEDRGKDLEDVRDQKAANEAAAQELEQAAKRMEQVLADLDRRRQEALSRKDPAFSQLDLQDFGANRGRLPWPVEGEVVTQFGPHQHPKYKTVIVSNGLDIAAAEGTEVRAVGPGIVDLVQWLPGYGETVILNHGRGYYTVYGHLGSVNVRQDDRVDPGHVLGTVGDTGSLKGVCLHFEVREGGDAQDPMLWLK
jgi:murein hydrolase activator